MAKNDSLVIKKSTLRTLSIVLFTLIIGIYLGSQFFAPKTGGTTTTTIPQTIKIDIPSFVPFRGSESAKINIVEFGDYQCPYCEQFFASLEPQTLTDYVNNGKTKFYFMDFQFLSADSFTLGQGAWCANDQGKYYEYHDYIYSHQGQERTGWATPDKVKVLAANISGIDTQKFNDCLDNKKYESRVQQLTQLGQQLGVQGTPTIFVGNDNKGYAVIPGLPRSYDVFKQVIEQALQKAG